MKPLKLSMQAFGPFAGREQIDFSRLPADALFLIHGPTGAGKTTLLDGICYALYGSTSGNERQPREMRSHHAPDALQTEVELEFELGGRRYLVKRVPEQERTALRGKKDRVKVAASAELHRHDGSGWVPIAAKPTEVSQHVEQILGFEAEQFRQVIMLPQGQFRKVLTAETREREKILETLFATDRYRKLQERLQESARVLERRAEEEKSRRRTLLDHAGADSEEALTKAMQALEQELESLTPQMTQARTAADLAAKALSGGEALAARFSERDHAQQLLQGLLDRDGALLTERQRLELAHKAQQAEPAWSVLSASAAQRAAQELKANAAATDAGAAETSHAEAEVRLAAETGKEPEREAARRDLARLEGLKAAVARLEAAQSEKARAFEQRFRAETTLKKQTQQAQALDVQRQTLHAEIERLTPLAADAEAARLESEALEKLMQTVMQIETAQGALAQATAAISPAAVKLEAAQNRVISARERRAELEEAWRAGQAAVLARHLVDSHACPVCGSDEHPSPATQTVNVPSEEELRHAAAAMLTAEKEFEAANEAYRSAEGEKNVRHTALITLQGTLSGQDWEAFLTPARRTAKINEAQLRLRQASEAAARLTQVKTQYKQCEESIQAVESVLAATRMEAMQAESVAAAAESALATLSDSVPQELRTQGALDGVIAKTKTTLATLEQALQSTRRNFENAGNVRAAAQARLLSEQGALAEAEHRQTEAQTGFDAALARSGFADAAAFQAARLAPEVLVRIERSVREHEQAKASAKERLDRAEEAVSGLQQPDLAALQAGVQIARDALEKLLTRHGTCRQQFDGARQTAALLHDISAKLKGIEQEYLILGELAAVAAGKNGANLAFQRYVLAALLDDVLRQASLRLKVMSRNRYALQRSSGVTDGRRAAGLDLEVLDDYTGRTRPANTLSGGEGFMASLALALGLSDTVQAYAGGIRLDTLFIDEGFGTLDPEALDLAMKTLIDLQRTGRMVGIISHVEELKRQIGSGIEVRFGPGGSTVRLGSPAAGTS